jgi:arylsulfatase
MGIPSSTPHLDALFASGTSFELAYAAVPSCIPARASVWTGLTPRHHGRVGYEEGVPWAYDVVRSQLLADSGYQTHCVGKMHVSPPRRRLGFHDVELHDGYIHFERDAHRDLSIDDDYLLWLQERMHRSADITELGLGCNGYVVRPWIADDRRALGIIHPSRCVMPVV